jgi:predicted phage tail protein
MRYYRFSRRRKNYQFDYNKSRRISTKKQNHMVNTGKSKLLDSFYFENQVWGALHKAWKRYTIAKNKDEFDKMLHYADIIQECQADLGLEVSSFHDIGKSALAFYSLRAAQIAEENKSNCNNQEQQVAEEEQNYLSDTHYEQERFTDAYTEDFEDDENKADRFTDTYRENFTD